MEEHYDTTHLDEVMERMYLAVLSYEECQAREKVHAQAKVQAEAQAKLAARVHSETQTELEHRITAAAEFEAIIIMFLTNHGHEYCNHFSNDVIFKKTEELLKIWVSKSDHYRRELVIPPELNHRFRPVLKRNVVRSFIPPPRINTYWTDVCRDRWTCENEKKGSEEASESAPSPFVPYMKAIEEIKKSLECGICYQLLCSPLSLSCGHTFCEGCLVTLALDPKKSRHSYWTGSPNTAEHVNENEGDMVLSLNSNQNERANLDVDADSDSDVNVAASANLNQRIEWNKSWNYICPACRTKVITDPMPNYTVNNVINASILLFSHEELSSFEYRKRLQKQMSASGRITDPYLY